jgi:hypothetical protein
MKAIHLTVDSKNRITLTKLIPATNISSVKAYTRDHKIILEPLVEIPAKEVWLYKNKRALKKVQKGLSQPGTVKRVSFSKYVDE